MEIRRGMYGLPQAGILANKLLRKCLGRHGYFEQWVDIAMPVYAIKNLTRYHHPPPLKPQNCPYTPNPIVYGKDNQAPTPGDTSPLLDATGKRCIQQIVGSFLYYARAVDPTILMALSAIAAQRPY